MQVTYTQAKGYHVIDIPEGMKPMFLGRLDDNFIVIIAPPHLFPEDLGDPFELDEGAMVAVGPIDTELELVEVKHGHKYIGGGGMVEWGGTGPCNRKSVGFRGKENPRAFYCGTEIPEIFFIS